MTAQTKLPWYYSLPITDEGKQKKDQIDLYRKNGDFNNMKLVAAYARGVEPGCFSFADAYVQSSYYLRQGDDVIKLSDSLVRCELATQQTFLTNAWLHDWRRDGQGAFASIDRGLNWYPDDYGLLRAGMSYAAEYSLSDKINLYGQRLLSRYPNDWQTYYDYMNFYLAAQRYDYSIIMAELALAVNPSNPKNIEIKYKLMESYDHWLNSDEVSEYFSSLSQRPQNLTKVSSMDDLIRLQSHMVYNYAHTPETNFLEARLFDFKLEVIQKCNWIAYCYNRFGISIFPQDYDDYLQSHAEAVPQLNKCISQIVID